MPATGEATVVLSSDSTVSRYINIDDCWLAHERDRFVPNTQLLVVLNCDGTGGQGLARVTSDYSKFTLSRCSVPHLTLDRAGCRNQYADLAFCSSTNRISQSYDQFSVKYKAAVLLYDKVQ